MKPVFDSMRSWSMLAALFLPACAAPPAQPGPATGAGDAALLRSRVGQPDSTVIEAYLEAGAAYARPHQLTEAEWTLVESALRELPPLHRRTLSRRLARLSFVDAPDGAGTALTRVVDPESDDPEFEITLRADALSLSLTGFLNRKEAPVFEPDASGYSVRIEASEMPALHYLLLHEATHVIDRAQKLTMQGAGAFGEGIWLDYRRPVPAIEDSPLGRTPFRGGPRVPLSQAPALYSALCQSPFVSLYATASAGEDFAELVAWRELSEQQNVSLQVEVKDAQGRSVLRLKPLSSPQVQARFRALDDLLEETPRRRSDAP